MSQEIFQVDAFTDTPFRGNPAAVCVYRRQEMNVGCRTWQPK